MMLFLCSSGPSFIHSEAADDTETELSVKL